MSHLHEEGRVRFTTANDDAVIEATRLLIRKEGIIPALESSHAFAAVIEESSRIGRGEKVLVNLSGRGDKDIFNIAEAMEDEKWQQFIKEKASLAV